MPTVASSAVAIVKAKRVQARELIAVLSAYSSVQLGWLLRTSATLCRLAAWVRTVNLWQLGFSQVRLFESTILGGVPESRHAGVP